MKKIFYIFCSMLAISFVACEADKFLEATPYGLASDGTFFRNESDAMLAINGAYRGLRQWNNGFNGDYGWGNIGTDDAWKGGASAADQPELTQLENYTILSTNAAMRERWQQDYQGIRNANTVLANVPGIESLDDALKNRIIGEAYFLRGAYYFDLAKYFGGVPLFTENLPFPADYLTIPRSTEAETWAFAEASLLEALSRLPKKSEYAAEDTGRATKGAALGFLARANLYQKKMDKVEQYCNQIFDLGEYTLAPTYREVFQPNGENGSGSIFEVQFKEDPDGWGASLGTPTGISYGPRSNGAYGGWGFTMARQELLDEFETNDPRLDHSFYNVPGQPYAPLDGTNSYFGRKVAFAPYSDYPKPGQDHKGPNNWRVIRLADVYLMYAEAIASSNPEMAIDYVNLVRARAREGNNAILSDVPSGTTGQALMDAIKHERRVELNLEGLRFQDLVRWGDVDFLETLGFEAGTHEKGPIPQQEIDNYGDPNILWQNNGY